MNKTKEDCKQRIIYALLIMVVVLLAIIMLYFGITSDEDFEEYVSYDGLMLALNTMTIISVITTMVFCIYEAYNMKDLKSEKDRINKNARKLENITPGLVELLIDYELDDFNKEIAVLAGLISKDYIEIDSNGDLIQKSTDRKKWLEHEKLVFDKYKNKSYVDIPNYDQALADDGEKLLLLKKRINEKEYKFFRKVLKVSLVITLFAILDVLEGYIGLGSYGISHGIACASGFITLFSVKVLIDYNSVVELSNIFDQYEVTMHGIKCQLEIEDFRKDLYDFHIYDKAILADDSKYVDVIPYAFAIGEEQIVERGLVYHPKYRNLLVLKNIRAKGEAQKDELELLKNVDE